MLARAHAAATKGDATVGVITFRSVMEPAVGPLLNERELFVELVMLRCDPIKLNIGSVLTSLQTGAVNAFAAPPVALCKCKNVAHLLKPAMAAPCSLLRRPGKLKCRA